MKKVLLYSGGLDSFIIKELWKPDILLYFDYGIEQNQAEISRLPKEAIIKKIDLAEYRQDDGISTIYLRNLIFASLAVNYGEHIAIGGVKEDWHIDKTEKFCQMATDLFNSVLNKDINSKNVLIEVPYKKYYKKELITEYLKNYGTKQDLIEKSWTCYEPIKINNVYHECGECKSCQRKRSLLENFN